MEVGGVVGLADGNGALEAAFAGDDDDRDVGGIRDADGLVEAGAVIAEHITATGVVDSGISQGGADTGEGGDVRGVVRAGREGAEQARIWREILRDQETLWWCALLR